MEDRKKKKQKERKEIVKLIEMWKGPNSKGHGQEKKKKEEEDKIEGNREGKMSAIHWKTETMMLSLLSFETFPYVSFEVRIILSQSLKLSKIYFHRDLRTCLFPV